ncbi:hypothetical protein BDQ17DRAFT_1371473 [Cyathus striatus]|nr:hypothetical protein BDQ17DRAFT_1371473 [Cyathus striatus]
MSFDDETQDIITRTGHRVRLRLYRDEDYQNVRDLFMYCMGTGPGAPRETALKDQLHQPFARTTYSLFTVGLALAIRPSLPRAISSAICNVFSLLPLPVQKLISKSGIQRILDYLRPSRLFPNLLKQRRWPLILSALSAGLFFTYMAFINYAFLGYCKDTLAGDLKDIGGRYQSPEALKKGGQFWVIEDVDKGTIAACLGLDTFGPTPELRRMCVDLSYRRLGFGNLLINGLLTHVLKHNARCAPELRVTDIILETSSYQPGAIGMYERHGWLVEKKKLAAWYVHGLYMVYMRRKMDVTYL